MAKNKRHHIYNRQLGSSSGKNGAQGRALDPLGILPVLRVIWSAIGSTRGIRKMLSHFGAIRVPQRNALKEIMGGNIKRYYVDMQEYTSVEAEVSTWRYRLNYDAGNVAYANWLQNAIGRESVRLYTGSTSLSAEACGDLVEAALGVFEVLSAFVHIPCIKPILPLNNVRMGIEEAILCSLAADHVRSGFENTKGRTSGTIRQEDLDQAARTLEILERPVMNPCIRGASENIYDEINPVRTHVNVESDSEFTEVGVDEEEAPDYGGDEENIGDGESVKRGEGLDAARKESVESFEEVLMKLSLAIPCHRCGSPDHSVLDCTVGVSVREMVNNLKRVIAEKNYVEDDSQGARGSDGEAPPKRHRRSEGRASADPGMEDQGEAMSDETAMMERYVMEIITPFGCPRLRWTFEDPRCSRTAAVGSTQHYMTGNSRTSGCFRNWWRTTMRYRQVPISGTRSS